MPCRMLLLALFGCLLVLASARDQNLDNENAPQACNHNGFELWDGLRVLPVHFIDVSGDTARWKYQDQHTVRVGTFVLAKNAKYVSTENKDVKVLYLTQRKSSDWLCYYCGHCHSLLAAYELKPGLPRS